MARGASTLTPPSFSPNPDWGHRELSTGLPTRGPSQGSSHRPTAGPPPPGLSLPKTPTIHPPAMIPEPLPGAVTPEPPAQPWAEHPGPAEVLVSPGGAGGGGHSKHLPSLSPPSAGSERPCPAP